MGKSNKEKQVSKKAREGRKLTQDKVRAQQIAKCKANIEAGFKEQDIEKVEKFYRHLMKYMEEAK